MMYDGGAGLEPWVEVRASGVPGAGNGVFALRDFSEGETVAVYMGAVVRAGEKEGYMERAYAKAKEYDESKGERGTQAAHEYVMQCGSVWIDGVTKGNVARYINDSRGSRWANNARLKQGGQYGKSNEGDERWGAAVVTTVRVAAGEEIFYDYGPEYWKWREAKKREEREASSSGRTANHASDGDEGRGSDDNRGGSSDQGNSASHIEGDNARSHHDKECARSRGGRTDARGSGAGEGGCGGAAAEMPHASHECRTQPHNSQGAQERVQGDSASSSDIAVAADDSAGRSRTARDGECEPQNDDEQCCTSSAKTNTLACSRILACNDSRKKGKERALVDRDWGEVRRERAKKASDAHGQAVKEARETRLAARRGDNERGRRVQDGSAVEGENSGKRRRLQMHAGRDGTGAVPAAVT